MKSIMMCVMMCVIVGCAGMNVVKVCSQRHCSTGFYNEAGEIQTTRHGFVEGEDIDISIAMEYEEHGHGDSRVVTTAMLHDPAGHVEAHDVLAFTGLSRNPQYICYEEVGVGEWVTVSTHHGPVRTKVVEKGLVTYHLSKRSLQSGDSGSPVTRRGCLVGMVRASIKEGVLVVAIRK
jgi:hypothetical protein